MRIRASLAAVLALTGFLVVTAAEGVGDARRAGEGRRSVLVKLIRERQTDVDAYGETIADLRRQVVEGRSSLRSQTAGEEQRRREVQVHAGTVALSGPGLRVTLSASDRDPRDRAEQEALAVHDVDLQLVVNALWEAGAEAIAVNGHRLVATSPIRAAGETITVNFRPLVPPYRVDAIGAGPDRFGRSEVARRYRAWERELGLGFEVSPEERLTVPGYRGALGPGAAVSAAGDGGDGS